MKSCISLLILLLFTGARLAAQHIINTDRPDQSDGTHIVEKNRFQFETGVEFSKQDGFTNGFDNTTLIRYGVLRVFEIRIQTQYSALRDSNYISGFKPLTVSFKNQLCKQHGLLPKLTLVSYFNLPVNLGSSFRSHNLGYAFTLAARHDLNASVKIYSNLGIVQDQESEDISYVGTLEFNYNITERFSAFLEYYGNFAHHVSASNGTDIGFIYAVRRNLAFDIAFGSSSLQPKLNRFLSFGTSVRLPD